MPDGLLAILRFRRSQANFDSKANKLVVIPAKAGIKLVVIMHCSQPFLRPLDRFWCVL